jgi:tRNA(Arg) A34 adenosine deaminase TadA
MAILPKSGDAAATKALRVARNASARVTPNHAPSRLAEHQMARHMTQRPTDAAEVSTRRIAIVTCVALVVAVATTRARSQTSTNHPQLRWYEAAAAMKRLAESWGDQPYGAVLVFGDSLIGEGPSRVVKNSDINAHAEREAIRDARRKLGRQQLAGSVLYSTSKPCGVCEAAAAEAGISRMYYGPSLTDAGVPGGAR